MNNSLKIIFLYCRTGKVKPLFLGTAEMTVPDVDEMPDDENYVSYQVWLPLNATHLIFNMLKLNIRQHFLNFVQTIFKGKKGVG